MSDALPSEQELKELRDRLIGTARKRAVPAAEIEDFTQEALYRVIKDDRASELPFAAKARRKLLDVAAEHFRSPKQAFLAAAEPLVDDDSPAREDAALGLIGLTDLVRSIAGDDVVSYARLRALKIPEREMAERLGWSTQRVAAARRKFARKTPSIVEAFNDSNP